MNTKHIFGVIILFFVVIVIIFGFGIKPKSHQSDSNKKLQVTTSFYPLYFFAQQIGGVKAEVTNITPAGAEPHDYEPTAQDIGRIENSILLILNGGGLEAWGGNIKQNIDSKRTLLITAGDELATERLKGAGQNVVDPHVWLSPPLAKLMADKIVRGFVEVDPVNGGYYEANADMLKARLGELDVEYRQGLGACAQKNIVTSHAAFGYLASAYNLNQVSIAGLSPDAEPSPQQLGQIADFARSKNIKYIFFESLASSKLSRTIATEIGAQTLVLNPIEGLSGEEILQGKDYFTEMRKNLVNLKIALQCQ